MMRSFKTLISFFLVFIVAVFTSYAAEETLMLRFPDIHKDKIVFTYAGDLWIANTGGDMARRLTTGKGMELFAKFSPDGEHIAFTGQYNGYYQVYVIPVTGGKPKQLTYYPATNLSDHQVIDWTPDGKYVAYRSAHDHWRSSYGQLYKVSIDGGWPERLPLTEGALLSYSPDGSKIAMNRTSREFRTWKRYKGGRQQDIWIYDFKTNKIDKITDWEGTDRHPMWHGDRIYYISDATKRMNIYYYDTKSKSKKQLTDFKDWDIRWPGFGPDAIVFEKGGRLFRMPFDTNLPEEIKVRIEYDRFELKPSYVNAARLADSGSLANGGKRFATTARGELFTVPAEKGDVRNLSNTPGSSEKNAKWSPDGKWIAYLSDSTGTEEIYLIDQFGKNKVQLTKDSKVVIFSPVWSPDSKKIAYAGTDQKLYYVDIDSKNVTEVDKGENFLIYGYNWSPDGKWITYTKIEDNNMSSIFVYSLEKEKVYRVTKNNTSDFEPVFDPDGKYIYFISRRDFFPNIGAFELSYTYTEMERVYMIPLQKATPSPFAPESDEVKIEDEKRKGAKEAKKGANKGDKGIQIDFEGISERAVALPVSPLNLSGLTAGKGYVYYIKRPKFADFTLFGSGRINNALYAYDIAKKKEIKVLSGVRVYDLSPDGKNILWVGVTHYGISPAGPRPIDPSKGKPIASLKLEALKIPRAEWNQMLKEAWRLQKNFFYVENMHGVDWPAMYDQYKSLIPHLTNRFDFSYILGEMIAELCCSHTYVIGSGLPRVKTLQIGLLGCDFEPDSKGYFRIKKIFRGENWVDNARSPLTEAGVKADEGDYILEINGKALRLPTNPYQLLEKTKGKIVTLKLNKQPVDKGAWTIEVKAIRSENRIRYLDWVEQNRVKVEKATGGKVGYVHIPDMMIDGLNQFVKMYYSQLNKQGIIVDERFNAGGFVSDVVLERLRRIVVGMAGGQIYGTFTYPQAAFAGHLVMLANKYAGSDGDYFPYFFKEYGLGPVIGTRTWGGVVGITGISRLMDGGMLTIPTSAMMNLKGEYVMENYGVDPDIEVDNLPQDVFRGKDAQLDKAIEVIMDMIKKEPVKLPPMPPPPVKLK